MSKEFYLKHDQKLQVLRVLEERGCNSDDFHFTKTKSSLDYNLQIERLIYKNTLYYFDFDFEISTESFWVKRCPGRNLIEELHERLSWYGVIDQARNWTIDLKDELSAIWTLRIEAKHFIEYNKNDIDSSNEIFKSDEIQKFTKRLEEIRNEFIGKLDKKHERYDQQIEAINKRIDFLQREISKTGKVTWFHAARSMMWEIATFVFTNHQVIGDIVTKALAKLQ